MDNSDKVVKQLERLNQNIAELNRTVKDVAKNMKALADAQRNSQTTNVTISGPMKFGVDYHKDLGHQEFVKSALSRGHDRTFIRNVCAEVGCKEADNA